MELFNRFVFFVGLFAGVEYGSSCWACVGKDVEVEVVLPFGIFVVCWVRLVPVRRTIAWSSEKILLGCLIRMCDEGMFVFAMRQLLCGSNNCSG